MSGSLTTLKRHRDISGGSCCFHRTCEMFTAPAKVMLACELLTTISHWFVTLKKKKKRKKRQSWFPFLTCFCFCSAREKVSKGFKVVQVRDGMCCPLLCHAYYCMYTVAFFSFLKNAFYTGYLKSQWSEWIGN